MTKHLNDDAGRGRDARAQDDAGLQPDADRQADAFRPFDNDTQVMTFTDGQDELTLENGPDAVLLAGQLSLSADEAGLRQVRALREALARIEAAIEAQLGKRQPGTPAPRG